MNDNRFPNDVGLLGRKDHEKTETKTIKLIKRDKKPNEIKAEKRPEPVKKEAKKSNKAWIVICIILVLLILLGACYLFGKNQYSKDKQIDQLTGELIKKNQTSNLVVSVDKRPLSKNQRNQLQEFYEAHPTQLQQIKANLKDDSSKAYKIVETGKFWQIYPKYSLVVSSYKVRVVTNQSNSTLLVDGQKYSMMKDKKIYQKEFEDLLPIDYKFVVKWKKQTVSKKLFVNKDKNIILNTKKEAPKKKSLSVGKQIQNVLLQSFTNPQAKDFVNGSRNKDYQVLDRLSNAFMNLNSVQVTFDDLYRDSATRYHSNYRLTYYFDDNSKTHKQVMRYTNAVFVIQDNTVKIKKIGGGKLIKR